RGRRPPRAAYGPQLASATRSFAAAASSGRLALSCARAGRLLRRNVDPTPCGAQSLVAAAAFLGVAAVSVAGLFEYNFGDKEVLMATLLLLALPFSRGMTESGERSPRIQS